MPVTIPANAVPVSVPMTTTARTFSPTGQKNVLVLGAGLALLAALIVAGVMWGRTPDYKVLYSNLSDKDGGAILSQLSQMNIAYKHADGGGAILVPSDQVHEARLKLASQGLPKGSTVGFELMENQRFGATQFQEQVNFQRGLEGELAKSIQSISSVQSARVHLALPKQSAFLREQQKPSASVILNLYPGRTLDRAQVAGIVHLVSSSVPDLPMKNVTALDQHGTLLSSVTDGSSLGGLDPDKLNYIQQLEQGYIRRVTDLLEPIVGRNNVRAQVTADVDFSVVEQTAETYKPNVGDASVRSSMLNEANSAGGAGGQGVPGALSNQPPPNPTAPIQGASGTPGQPVNAPTNTSGPGKRDVTTNYEVDKTIRMERRPVGSIKRLSAAVVVNNSRVVDSEGKVSLQPLSEADLAKLTTLVREAVGFSQTRGDSLNVVNVPFNVEEKVVASELPLWKQPENISMAKEAGKALALLVGLLVLIFACIRPAMKSLSARRDPIPPIDLNGPLATPDAIYSPGMQMAQLPTTSTNNQLQQVRQLAQQNPATVANVVRTWVNKDG